MSAIDHGRAERAPYPDEDACGSITMASEVAEDRES